MRSSETSLNAMMWEHREEVEQFLLLRGGLPSQEDSGAEETLILPSAPVIGGNVPTRLVEGDGDTIMVTAAMAS